MRKKTLGLVFLAAAAGCSKTSDDGARAPVSQPLKRVSGPTPATKDTGFPLADDGKMAGKTIVVDLDTLPAPDLTWAATACQPVLAADYLLGELTCADDGRTRAISAGMVRQICSTDPKFGPAIEPIVPLGLDGCNDLKLAFYSFSPALKITIVGNNP